MVPNFNRVASQHSIQNLRLLAGHLIGSQPPMVLVTFSWAWLLSSTALQSSRAKPPLILQRDDTHPGKTNQKQLALLR